MRTTLAACGLDSDAAAARFAAAQRPPIARPSHSGGPAAPWRNPIPQRPHTPCLVCRPGRPGHAAAGTMRRTSLPKKDGAQMKTLTASIALVVALLASAAQGGIGYTCTYDFNNLTEYQQVYGQVTGAATWDSVNVNNQRVIYIRSDPLNPSNRFAACNTANGEQLISTLTNYDPNVPASLLNLESTDTQLRLSWNGAVNGYAGYMVGIWIDGIDALPNTATTDELEHAVQFGTDYVYQSWRVRGAGGANSIRDTTGMPAGNVPVETLLTLDIDLWGNGGDGSMSLTVKDLSTGIETAPPLLQNMGMALLTQDPNHETYGDPSRWTGWYIRSGRLSGGAHPPYTMGYHTFDNLTVEVIPEPATLAVLLAGGLAVVRRRRGRRET